MDVPEVVELRRKLLPSPKGDYTLLGIDVTDPTWLDDIPSDRPTLVIMEGLLMYLTEEEGKGLLRRLVERFPGGALLFDCIPPAALQFQNWTGHLPATGATFSWAIGDPKDIETVHEKLKLKEDLLTVEQLGFDGYPWLTRWTMSIVPWLPYLRHTWRNLKYEF